MSGHSRLSPGHEYIIHSIASATGQRPVEVVQRGMEIYAERVIEDAIELRRARAGRGRWGRPLPDNVMLKIEAAPTTEAFGLAIKVLRYEREIRGTAARLDNRGDPEGDYSI